MRKPFSPRQFISHVAKRKQRKLLLEALEGRLALAIVGLGVAGDSWSDEYAAETYNYARNWAELLVSERGVNLGAPGDYPDDERGNNGTAFNWAQVGATADDMINQLQDFHIIDQYQAGDISHAVFMASNSDLAPGSIAFNNVADGTWTKDSFEIFFFIGRTNELMVGALGSYGPKTLVTTIPDPTMTPAGKALSAVGKTRVREVVDYVNARIKAQAAAYHLPVVDLAALSTQLLGTPSAPKASITVGGNIIDTTGGTPSTNLFLADGILPHTVYQGYVANAIIEGLNSAFGENIPRLTEQQIVTAAGLTYGGTDTFNVNYSNLVIAPPVTVVLSYGQTGTPNDSFTERVSEWATARGIDQLTPDVGTTPGELSQVKANILAKLQTAFAGTVVNFTDIVPTDPRFEAIKLGVLSDGVTGTRTSRIGQSTFDWLNASDQSTGYVFVDLITRGDPVKPDFDNINLAALPRAEQLRYLENVLSFYIANEIGRGMGLQASDAFAYPSITTANANNTGGVQFLDYMSGDPALGFDTSVFNGTPTFTFSPLAKAKLQYGHWLTNPTLATIAEAGSAHDTTATAQTIALVNSSTSQQRVGLVKGAAVSGGSEVDLYKISGAAVGDKITAQVFSTGVYGSAINSAIRLLAADGTTVLAFNDDTLLGNNRLNQAGDTNVDLDALIMNYVVETAGDIYVEVKSNGSAGSYDLMVANTVAAVPNPFPWQNASNPYNVDGNTTGTAVTAFDAVPIINLLNLFPTGFALPTPTPQFGPPPTGTAPFYDLDGNNTVTAFDVVPIINYLNINPLGGPGPGGEFVPFAWSAPEAIEPEEPASSSSNSIVPPLPSQPLSSASSSSPSQSAGQLAGNIASNPLTWLLLAPVSAGGEESSEEESGSGSSEEHAQALESLLGEE